MLLLTAIILAIPLFSILVYWLFQPIILTYTQPHSLSYKHKYYDTITKEYVTFPNILDDIDDNDLVDLSLIVPAYNESQRIDIMMNDTMKYINERKNNDPTFTYEMIIVDDGSRDNTVEHALSWSSQYTSNNIRVLELSLNQGKGGAVQQGVLHSRGRHILFLDADGATNIYDIDKLQQSLITISNNNYNNHGICIGSRKDLELQAISQRKWYRNILMYGFHVLVYILGGVRSIKDTQCGFKLFTRQSAKSIFPNQYLRRWCFDVELLSIAQSLHIPIAEISVRWQEVPGSKIRIFSSSILMARDLFILRIAYLCGIWHIKTIQQNKIIKNRLQNRT